MSEPNQPTVNWADAFAGLGLGFFFAVWVARLSESQFILSVLAIGCFLAAGGLRAYRRKAGRTRT